MFAAGVSGQARAPTGRNPGVRHAAAHRLSVEAIAAWLTVFVRCSAMNAHIDHAALTSAARLALEQWSARLGSAGRAAMAELPGLVAEVDQHAAEVRAAVVDAFGRLCPINLAAYADGLADVAAARGWSADEVHERGWQRASWPSLRLLAICQLHESGAAQTA